METRYKIFRKNCHKLKKAREYVVSDSLVLTEMPRRDLIGSMLYASFKLIEKGEYQVVMEKLEKTKEQNSGFIGHKEFNFINKTINTYLKAYHATIPLNLAKESLKDIRTDRKTLSEIVESFKE